MKYCKIKLLLERTLEYNTQEYSQLLGIIKNISLYTPMEVSLKTLIDEFEIFQKELYEFWFARVGSKKDIIPPNLHNSIEKKTHGVIVPEPMLPISQRLNEFLSNELVVNMFPPNIIKIIRECATALNQIFNSDDVVWFNRGYRLIVTMCDDPTHIAEVLTHVDAMLIKVAAIEFYVGAWEDQRAEYILQEYRHSELSNSVSDNIRQFLLDNPIDEFEERESVHNDLYQALECLEQAIALSFDEVKEPMNTTPVKLVYNIDPKTNLVIKTKDPKTGKMVPSVRMDKAAESREADYSISKKDTTTSRSYSIKRYKFEPNLDKRNHNTILAELRLTKTEIDKHRVTIKKILDKATRTGAIEDDPSLDYDAIRERLKQNRWYFVTWGNSIGWAANLDVAILDKLSSNDDPIQFDENHPPADLIKLFVDAENEIVDTAKLVGWI